MGRGPITPFDETLEVASDELSKGSAEESAVPNAHVTLVDGKSHGLWTEMQSVLRWRLRIAALVLCGGFLVFLVYRLFVVDWSDPVERRLLVAHIAVTCVLGILGGLLCRKCPISLRKLRFDELVMFAAPATFFVMTEWNYARQCAAEHQMIPTIVHPWFMLIFTYALFIPNDWRRAATVLGLVATVPMVMLFVLWIAGGECAAVISAQPSLVIEQALLLIIAATAGTIGTHTIGTLRREAFQAKQVGQYRLKKLLGAGGMGEVHLAEHQMMKRPCALKLIRPDRAGDPTMLARFEREVRATAGLSHWNTIEIFDYGRTDCGAFYYVMEYLPGLSLEELVDQHGPLEPARVNYLLRQVCDGLREAHSMGMIHRDIKPGNIFAAQRGGVYDVAKLLDFGLVKPVLEIRSAQITQDGMITGSPLYMSPEQATGDSEADERSDIYSLGAVAYYLLTGSPPFQHKRPMKVILAHASEEVIPPSQINPSIPHDLEQIVLRCLEKSPEHRFPNVSELAEALESAESADGWSRDDAQRWWETNGRTLRQEPAYADA